MEKALATFSGEAGSVKEANNKKWILGAFLVWPFIGFLLAVFNFGSRFNKGVILAFFVIYGLTFVVNSEMDGQRYADELKMASGQSLNDMVHLLSNLYGEHDSVDIVQPLLTFFVSIFSSEHYLLFGVFAFVFGYFYLKSISLVYKEYAISRTSNAFLFLFFLPWIIPIFEINGFRMWTASWVFFYGTYQVVYKGKARFLWFALGASMIHFSFLSACVILLLYLLLKASIGQRISLFMCLAVATFFLSEMPLEPIRNFAMSLGGGVQNRIGYFSDSYIEQVGEQKENAVWFMKLAGPLLFYFLMIQVFVVYFQIKKFNVSGKFNNFFAFCLLFLSFSNVASLLPSGGRFKEVLFVFLVSMLVIFYSKVYVSSRWNKLLLVGVLPFVLNALIALRIGGATLNTLAFAPSFYILIFNDTELPLTDWLF